MRRTRARTSRPVGVRPGGRRDFKVQKRLKAVRCQRTTVSGRTIARASRQRDHVRDSAIQKKPIGPVQGREGTLAAENGELLAKSEVLDDQVSAGADGRPGSGDEGEKERKHRRSYAPWRGIVEPLQNRTPGSHVGRFLAKDRWPETGTSWAALSASSGSPIRPA